MRHKVAVISACYSGIFITSSRANPDMLVVTAADADHPSFGCQDKAKWTYFDVMHQQRRAPGRVNSPKDAFALAGARSSRNENCVSTSSHRDPLMAGGANRRLPLLVAASLSTLDSRFLQGNLRRCASAHLRSAGRRAPHYASSLQTRLLLPRPFSLLIWHFAHLMRLTLQWQMLDHRFSATTWTETAFVLA